MEVEHQVLHLGFVVILVFQITIVQVVVAENERSRMWPGIVTEESSYSEGLLCHLGQIAEDVG